MKINCRISNWRLSSGSRFVAFWPALALCSCGYCADFVAHEWGTFTSVQGADGVAMEWRAQKTSRLPGFVYNWQRPGPDRTPDYTFFPKGLLMGLQRMETPVIYFYSEDKQAVEVTVDFPQGIVTEWYPQTSDTGCATGKPSPEEANVEKALPAGTKMVNPKRLHWGRVQMLPMGENGSLASALPGDTSGSHYFAARDTDANYLQSSGGPKAHPELEKFLFYRGVGQFATPLRVTVDATDSVIMTNTGAEPLDHLVVLSVENGTGNFSVVDRLAPGEQCIVAKAAAAMAGPLGVPGQPLSMVALMPGMPREVLESQLVADMTAALTREGLYPREAAAMVNTWKDSWFEEDGVRVFYVLPREWTDRTLPLKFNPAPREMVRVMLGRAEVLTPALERRLSTALRENEAGDAAAGLQIVSQLRKLGRFAGPALQLAAKGLTEDGVAGAWRLFALVDAPGTDVK